MSRNNKSMKCRCGSSSIEKIDITPVGSRQQRYFVRCRKCGLVIRGEQSGRRLSIYKTLNRIWQKAMSKWLNKKRI